MRGMTCRLGALVTKDSIPGSLRVSHVGASGSSNPGVAMKTNIGSIDRIVGGVAGIGLIAWALMGGPVWAWIGVLPLVTAVIGWWPVYVPFGISTVGKK